MPPFNAVFAALSRFETLHKLRQSVPDILATYGISATVGIPLPSTRTLQEVLRSSVTANDGGALSRWDMAAKDVAVPG